MSPRTNGFWDIFVGIPKYQKGYLVYVLHKHKIVYLYNFVFGDNFSSAFTYTSQPYSEAMDMLPTVPYIPHSTYSKEKTGNTITFTHFEEGNLLSEYHNNTESGKNYDDDSTLPPLISES